MSVTGTESDIFVGIEEFVQACTACWPSDQARPRIVTRVPGRLDCMGGMADFSGALALQMPIDRAVYLAVGRRDDEKISVESIGWSNDQEPARCDWPIGLFYQSDGQLITADDLAAHFDDCTWVRNVAGVFLALLESGDIPHFGGGVTVVLQSGIPSSAGLASSAAIQIASAKALAGLFDIQLDQQALLRACRTANAETVKAQPNLVDHATCLLAEANHLLQIRCQPDDILGPLALPKGVIFVGVDSGLRLPIYAQRYEDNRVTSLMGRHIIESMLRASGEVGDPTGGYLANISPSEYVRRFRNELPIKMRGNQFFDRFGRTEELEAIVVPEQIYKIRSRTEHHIYENDRTHRFMERISRARRSGERDALIEAGELMYASHWSYGQRCGMGSIETDVLVNAIRERGSAQGLYGAKVTGGGCGGTVAVLLADNPAAHQALEQACGVYAEKTSKKPTILAGSSPGAMAFGHRVLD